MEKIKEVKIAPGCISCGTCQVVCPKVFEIDDISHVREDADLQQEKDCIKEAAEMCPVKVIEIVWDRD